MGAPVRYHLGKFPPAPESLDWRRLVPAIGKANAALARYDGLLSASPNAGLLLSPLTTQEAVLSSKIEGTNVTMGEVLEVEAGGEPKGLTEPKRRDIDEVRNYREALSVCAKVLEERSLSQHLIREAHQVLMRGVRGEDKTPGQYRNDQNWIGPSGCSVEEARFVPVAPEHLQTGMDQWARFLEDTSQPDPLVQLALAHVEFEALHPFRDGNGRMGRMLIPLYLFQRRLLGGPYFYMSSYLEAHRDLYLEQLRAVSRDDAWTEWCEFFLVGIAEQAAENERRTKAALELHKRTIRTVAELTHSQHADRAADFLFQQPIFAAPHFIEKSGVPKPTAIRMLTLLRQANLIQTLREGKGRRFGVYCFGELLVIAEGRASIE